MSLGFSVYENILSPFECDGLLNSLLFERSVVRAGLRNLMGNEFVSKMANDARLTEIAKSFIQKDAIPFRATLFNKSGKFNWLVTWHQDTALPLRERFSSKEWGPWSQKNGFNYAHAPEWALSRVIALRIHLDDSTIENGPLRVLPGTQRLGVLSEKVVIDIAKKMDAVKCVASKGGVIAMRPLLIHASSKSLSSSPRRVLHIEYLDSLDLAEGIRLAVA
jgi:ectoine hydroxylase-related dioxygenase (phytanoyl-CoA dioxygenase family)